MCVRVRLTASQRRARGRIIARQPQDVQGDSALPQKPPGLTTSLGPVVPHEADLWIDRPLVYAPVEEGFIYINGKKLNEPYVKANRRGGTDTLTLRDIPPRNT
jgi:hypothetical protein